MQTHEAGKLDPKMEQLYFKAQRPMFELYDLEKDPGEFNNLAGNMDAGSYERELKAAMQEWMILQRDFLPLPVTPTEGPGAKGKKH